MKKENRKWHLKSPLRLPLTRKKLIQLLVLPFYILGTLISLSLALVVVGFLSRVSFLRRTEKLVAREIALQNKSKYMWE
jgi:hypothetical protein